MQTITFYSYKGGTGRSLALANAAVYLATMGFRVVALDFDLEAPGLHYKLSRNEDGSPLDVQKGLVDYVVAFLLGQRADLSLKDYYVEVPVAGVDKPVVHLIPAGRVPSSDYWTKLARINWYELFYSKGAKGVQLFMELKAMIMDELKPDFLLVDSRTGITEMGGVATTLFADKLVCLVLPTRENIEGARAVLRSLRRARREAKLEDLEIMIALSRLPKMKVAEDEREQRDRILAEMNEDAADLSDTLNFRSVFVLHSEPVLQVRETLRVGSGVNPDDSILLRDYLRLFVSFVPRESIEPKVRELVNRAWEKLRQDPDAAVKDMEELAESFGHPENYRELLRFYQVRNISGTLALKRAQRLWEMTGDPSDTVLWQVVTRSFEAQPRWQRRENQWQPNLDFVRAAWQTAGAKDSEFGTKLAEAYVHDDRDSEAADVLLEIINACEPNANIVARCISLLEVAKRTVEAESLILKLKSKFVELPEFATAWARYALRAKKEVAFPELTKSPWAEKIRPALRALLYVRAGLGEEANAILETVLKDVRDRNPAMWELEELNKYFISIGRQDEFVDVVSESYPEDFVRELRGRPRARVRRRFGGAL